MQNENLATRKSEKWYLTKLPSTILGKNWIKLKNKENETEWESTDICFYTNFDCYYQNFVFEEETGY